jgi:hypothetical protein
VSFRRSGVPPLQRSGRRAAAGRSPGRLAGRVRRGFTALAVVAASALVLFHVALFAVQAGAGRLLDPAVSVKWGLSVLLCLALVALRRSGIPLLWGRRALVVWLLVGLLHWNTAPAPGAGQSPVLPQVIVELQSSAGLMLFATGLLLALLHLRRALMARPARPLPRVVSAIRRESPLLSLHLASRAPPMYCLA